MSDEQLLGLRFCDLKLQDRTHAAREARAPPVPRTRQAPDRIPSARVAVGRMVFSRRRARHRGAFLPRASAARASRATHDAQRRRRQRRKRDAHPAARSGTRHRHRVSTAPSQALARSVRSGVAAVSGYLQGAARQPPLCAAPGRVVRAVASLRGFRGDLRRVAQAEFLVAPHVCAVARVPQTRIRRRTAGRACATSARRCAIAKSSSRCATTRARSRITIAASSSATACIAARSPITCSSACSRRERPNAHARRASTFLRAHAQRS